MPEMIDHISPSMLGLFCRCQEAFRRRYIEGIKLPPGIAACIGTGMHKGAEGRRTRRLPQSRFGWSFHPGRGRGRSIR